VSEDQAPEIVAFLAATEPWKKVAHELAAAAEAALGQPQDEDTTRDLTALRDALLEALVRVEVLGLMLAGDDEGEAT
jgi:hypothetical protein